MVSIKMDKWRTPRPYTVHTHPQELFLHVKQDFYPVLFFKSFGNMSGCNEFAVFTEERRVIIGKCHRHGRFVDGDSFQRFRFLNVSDRISDLQNLRYRSVHKFHLIWADFTLVRPKPSKICNSLIRCFEIEPSFLHKSNILSFV